MPQSLNFGKAVLQAARGGRAMSGNPSSEADKEDGFHVPGVSWSCSLDGAGGTGAG